MKFKKTYSLIIFIVLFMTGYAQKKYITPQEFLEDSFCLAKQVMESDFQPTFLVALWRGGAPIGMAMTEYFAYKNKPIANHITVRVSAYNHDQLKPEVYVCNLDYLVKTIKHTDKLLLVDDIIDSGSSIIALLDEIQKRCRQNTPQDIRIATIYYKPEAVAKIPYQIYCMHEAKNWLVFPHELEGLTFEEIAQNKGATIAKMVS